MLGNQWAGGTGGASSDRLLFCYMPPYTIQFTVIEHTNQTGEILESKVTLNISKRGPTLHLITLFQTKISPKKKGGGAGPVVTMHLSLDPNQEGSLTCHLAHFQTTALNP